MPKVDHDNLKKLASGPAGELLSKYPLRFAKPVLFGERPQKGTPCVINTATATLVDLDEGPLAITCAHVVRAFLDRVKRYVMPIFQIGDVEIPIVERLILNDDLLDLATIRLTEKEMQALSKRGEIGSCVYRPRVWPPKPVKENDCASFGGFPASMREISSFHQVQLPSWSCGGSAVSSASENQFVSAFDRDYWVKCFGGTGDMTIRELGGMSGGPVFIDRGLYRELVGIVSSYNESYDAMVFSKIAMLQPNGERQKSML